MKRTGTWLVIVIATLASLALIAVPVPAAAEAGSQAEARVHFKKGEADYAAGRYADALAAYQAGYDARPLPGFLVNIAQCQRRLGDLAHARGTYQRFIMVAPDSPLVPEVQKLVADLNQLLADAQSQSKQSAPAAPRASGISNETMELDLGEGHPSGDGAGSPASGGSQPPVSLALPPSREAQPTHVTVGAQGEPAAEPPAHRRWWLWGGAAAVVVAGGATAAILLSRGDSATTIHDGSLGTVRR